MSLRPVVYSANIKPLLYIAETLDRSPAPLIIESYQSTIANNATTMSLLRDRVEALFSGGVKGKPETEDQVHVIGALAEVLGLQVPANMLLDGDWSHDAWEDYHKGVQKHLDPKASNLFSLLLSGQRPLFGSSIHTSWAYYSYLHHEEVVHVHSALKSLGENHPEIVSPDFIGGFHFLLMETFESLNDAGTDLWMFAQ